MEILKKIGVYSLIFLSALFIFFVNIFSGKNGIYFFDQGISYNFGWLLYNGKIPYIDIITPLGPLNGYLIALGYKLFGVNFMSSVYLSGILSFGAFIYSIFLFKNKLKLHINILYNIAMVLAAFSMIGTLYYNNLIAFFVVIFFNTILNRLLFKSNSKYTLFMWTIIVLMGLTKFHMGFLSFIIGIIVELLCNKIHKTDFTKDYFLKNIFLPLFIGSLLLCLCFHFDFSAFFFSVFQPKFSPYTFQHENIIYYNFYKIVLLFFILSLFWGLKKNSSFLIGISSYFILSSALLYCTLISSTDTVCFFHISVLTIIVTLFLFNENTSIKKFGINKIISSLLLLSIIYMNLSELNFIYYGKRKTFEEISQSFIVGLPIGEVEIKEGFFKNVRIRKSQYEVVSIIDRIIKANQDKKIHFSGMMEMMFPAEKIVTKHKWILWTHPDVSFSPKKISNVLKKILEEENYDIIFYAPRRLWASQSFMNLDKLGYKYRIEVYWIGIAVKDKETSSKILSIINKHFKSSD